LRLPDAVVAVCLPADVQLKPAYPLAQALDDRGAAQAIHREARALARLQDARRKAGARHAARRGSQRLLAAPIGDKRPAGPLAEWVNPARSGAAFEVLSSNRQGATVRLHAGSDRTSKIC
jgi:ParB family chromosome partitioning protein